MKSIILALIAMCLSVGAQTTKFVPGSSMFVTGTTKFVAPASVGGTTYTEFITSTPTPALRNNVDILAGMQFSSGGAGGGTVQSLSRWKVAGNSQTHRVGLFNSGGVLLAVVSVNASSGTAGTFQQVALGSPYTCAAGNLFEVLSEEFNGGDQWEDDQAYTTDGYNSFSLFTSVYSVSGWTGTPWQVGSSISLTTFNSGHDLGPTSFGHL